MADKSGDKNTQFDYKQIFDHSPIPYWIYDTETLHFVAVNQAAIDKYGYTEEEFLSMTIRDIRPAEDIPLLEDAVHRADTRYKDWRHRNKAGDIFYVQILSTTVTWQGHEARAVKVIDISKRVEAERRNTLLYNEVLRQKDQLEMINASLTDVVWSAEMGTFRPLYINAACEKMFGYTVEEMMQDPNPLFGIIYPDDKEKFKEGIQRTLATGSDESEIRILHKDGTIKTFLVQGHVRKNALEGMPDILTGIIIDITGLRKAQNDLQEKAEEMQAILDGITDGFYTLDNEWRFTYVNPALTQSFNVPREEVVGKHLLEATPQVEHSIFYPAMAEAYEKQHTTYAEGVAPSNGRIYFCTFYPIKNGLAVYSVDVTEYKEKETQVQRQNQLLREIAHMQSHQLRGPVASILGLAQLVNMDNFTDPANKELLHSIIEATRALDDVIKHINDKTSEAAEG